MPVFGSNTFNTYAYEPFSYVISNPPTGTQLLSITTRTPGIPTSYLTIDGSSSVTFAASSNGITVGQESFTITASDISAVPLGTSANTVNILAGRFVDPLGNSITGSNYTFYVNEPIAPIKLIAPFKIGTKTATPSLPPGLSFSNAVDISTVTIIGTPSLTSPQTSYLVIGKQTGSSKVVSSTFGIVISNERIRTSPTSIDVTGMLIGSNITPRTITSIGNGAFRYTWNTFPDGIYATDGSGNTVSNGFYPSDASHTLIVRGTPTFAAATAFKNLGYSNGVTQTILVERTSPLPLISSPIAITFAFGETVLFDTPSNRSFYRGVPLAPTANFFRAATYFNGNVLISNMTATGLPTGLDLSFNRAAQLGYLIGTPTVATPSSNYTLSAINDNGKTRTTTVGITIVQDTVSFVSPTPAIDTSYSFVISRSLSSALPGFYPYPIAFAANAASGQPITWSSTGLDGSLLALSSTSGSSVYLTGTPYDISSTRTATITATSASTNASNSTTIRYEILDDIFTFEPLPPIAWIQNKAINPIEFIADTASGRPITRYTSGDLPTGIFLSSSGFLTGTLPTDISGSFTVTATTGFSTGSKTFDYTVTPDSILFLISPTSYSYTPGANVSIDVNAIAYSGKTVSNYVFSNFTPSYGLTIGSTTGLITGTFNDTSPPIVAEPTSAFDVNASVAAFTQSLPATVSVTNPIAQRSFLFEHTSSNSTMYITDNNVYTGWDPTTTTGKWLTDFRIKNTTVDSNTFVICDSSGSVLRSKNGVAFTSTVFANPARLDRPYKVINLSNTPVWYIAGSTTLTTNQVALFKSIDDGLTWNSVTELAMSPRQHPDYTNYYTSNGVAFGYSNGVMMMGGGSNPSTPSYNLMMRSTDMGLTWAPALSSLQVEVGNFCLDGPVWVATGSELYSSGSRYDGAFSNAAYTMVYSSDQGQTWLRGSNAFDVVGYEVAYASNTWLATGMSRDPADPTNLIQSQLICSTDGMSWSNVTLTGTTFTSFSNSHLSEVSSLWFDGSNWNVMVKKETAAPADAHCIMYTHDLSSSLTSGWTKRVNLVAPFEGRSNITLTGLQRQYIRPVTPTVYTLTFSPANSGGPVFTSPTQQSYIYFQYIPIAPITLSVSDVSGPLYYFVDTTTLPDGIVFDPQTTTFSGMSVQLGYKVFDVYAKDNIGFTRLTIAMNTILPRVIRQQDGAGAWTSLLRQYTEVNAAETARDNKALPAIEYRLGEFTSPVPPSVITAPPPCNP